ncbi:MAG: ABC transporter ATP-binding protein [Eubacteriales bacterium]|nr:ABC transporter ATP-binding protein [Eubacteriales bacterium]
MSDEKKLLEVKDLSIAYQTDLETVHAVNHVTFSLNQGETLGLVGETGAGKTTTALGIMGLLPKRTAKITSGNVYYEGKDLLQCGKKEMLGIRGSSISMIFQDPMTALNPVLCVGDQIAETLQLHNAKHLTREEIEAKVDETLELVGIPKERKKEYPYQFSGGMRQRVVIAMALINDPSLLIADEPTTALDVTIQAQILSMICELQRKYKTAVMMITHDLGIVAETCDKVAVMYAGEIVEYGTLEDIFTGDRHHPYTVGLFGSIPSLTRSARRLQPIEGLMPDPTQLPEGCAFAERCRYCQEICRTTKAPVQNDHGHLVRCYFEGQPFAGEED